MKSALKKIFEGCKTASGEAADEPLTCGTDEEYKA
jgi:hypothetical protein